MVSEDPKDLKDLENAVDNQWEIALKQTVEKEMVYKKCKLKKSKVM